MSALVLAVLIACLLTTLLRLLMEYHLRRKNARAEHTAPGPAEVESMNEDDLLFTHAKVVDQLSPEVRRALFGDTAPGPSESSAPESTVVWWRSEEHRLETELMDGPIGDPEWNVFTGTCSGCDWRFSARRDELLKRFNVHAEELVPASHVTAQTPYRTKAGGRGVKVHCTCGWYEYLTHRSLSTPDACAASHLREVKVSTLLQAMLAPEQPTVSVVPLVLKTERPEQVRFLKICRHEDTAELRNASGWHKEICTRCGAETAERLGEVARLARPTRPSPTTGERRG